METTDRHALPYLIAAQAQKHVTVNETFRALDALVQMSVRSASVAAEPGAPVAGEGYILPAGKSGGVWSSLPDDGVAVWQDGAWASFAPLVGMTVYVEDESGHRVWDGAAWAQMASGSEASAPQQTSAPQFGVNAEGDATNKLVVKSDAILHSHDDVAPGSGDVRHVLNKADAAKTASFVFQSNWSGRAELGLAGNDDFSFKVSADGASFTEALRIDRSTGSVSFPNTDIPTTSDVSLTARAFADGLAARLLSNGGVGGGNLARTKQVVMTTTTGRVQIGSAADGNVVEVYANGQTLADGIVERRLFMARGQTALLEGLSAGAVIASTGGISGASECIGTGTAKSPMPLGLEGFSGRRFFFYAFRDSAGGAGQVTVAAGAVPARVTLLSGDGSRIVDQASLPAFGLATLSTDADAEFQVAADEPVFAAVAAGLVPGAETWRDLRLVPPLATELIGWSSKANVSALYANTTVRWAKRSGTSGSFTVSPGAPVNLGAIGIVEESDYEPNGCLILRADGPISAYSGADGKGFEATPYFPLAALGQRVALPLASQATGDGAVSGISVASPYEGTARLHDAAGALVATLPLTRMAAVTTPDDQLMPCAACYTADQTEATVLMTTDFLGGTIEADVPIYVVQNAEGNAALTGGIDLEGDELAWPGVTPDEIRAEIRRDEGGFLRRRQIAADGTDSWVLC